MASFKAQGEFYDFFQKAMLSGALYLCSKLQSILRSENTACSKRACSHPIDKSFKEDVYSVEELVANPQNFAHTMVTVKGCFVRNFELEVLEPCGGGLTRGKMIWVEGAGTVAMMLRSGPEFIPYTPKGGLLFAYDEARDSRAWQKLPSGYSIVGSEVVLLGQFETSTGGFGHLGAYSNELIFVDVLSNKPITTRPKSR